MIDGYLWQSTGIVSGVLHLVLGALFTQRVNGRQTLLSNLAIHSFVKYYIRMKIRREVIRATVAGLVFAITLAILIIAGSRNLSHFDAALVGYTFATLFATFGIVYRYSMWLQKPPTALYWKRGWKLFFSPKYFAGNFASWLKRITGDIALNSFIFKRSPLRGLSHMLLMWGCVLAAVITFPLVFGWIHFESAADQIDRYRIYFFGFPAGEFEVKSFIAFLVFHGLVWSAIAVIAGVMLSMRRRMRDGGAAAVQDFLEDFLPLILLFAISLSGLLLTVSYTWMKGYAYDFLAILHAAIVIFTLLWLPFGKFFHIFQRPAQLGVSYYKDVGVQGEHANCRRCGHPFTSKMHVEDLIEVEQRLGYRYEIPDNKLEHYQWICPPCRRAMLAIAQGKLANPLQSNAQPGSAPEYANPGMQQGPLGEEDQENFHP